MVFLFVTSFKGNVLEFGMSTASLSLPTFSYPFLVTVNSGIEVKMAFFFFLIKD